MSENEQTNAIRAVLCDIDGTLVDSNYAHIVAWSRALAEVEVPSDTWRIHRALGMDSDKLLQALLGDEASRVGEEAKELHTRYYVEAASGLRPMAGARELVMALTDRGLRVVLATSAPDDELAILRGVLDLDDVVAGMTSASDVEVAKPEPDIVRAALAVAGAEPHEAIMLGDAAWDMRAAAAAGVASVGVRCGGLAAAELLEAGAVAVYDDPASLLEDLGDSPFFGSWPLGGAR
jgi:HAD superfamily hydrolase (TIGR01509 family)